MHKHWRYFLYVVILVGSYIWLLISPALYSNSPLQEHKKITITGHRGAAGYAPENTLASFKKALALNVDRIELDIHQSKDGMIVVIHDESVDRTSDGNGLISELSFDEIRKLDVGSSFSKEFKGEKIPSLEEVIQLINGQCDLLIEFKNGNDHYPGIEEKVIALIHKYDAVDWCIVHSFNTKVLIRINQKIPALRLHKLFIIQLRFTPLYYSLELENYDPKDYPFIEEYSFHQFFGNQNIINKLHQMGKKVNIWTLDDPKRMQAYRNLGIDGIITDYPDLIQR
jgi:glycerophosphoryl diester phosphodiesterase